MTQEQPPQDTPPPVPPEQQQEEQQAETEQLPTSAEPQTAVEDHVREEVLDDMGNDMRADPSYRDYVEVEPPEGYVEPVYEDEGEQPPEGEPAA